MDLIPKGWQAGLIYQECPVQNYFHTLPHSGLVKDPASGKPGSDFPE
jgi:hypothetical protein